MITVLGVFGNYNELIGDNGEMYKAYPYKIDFSSVYNHYGFFMLKLRGDGTYTIVQYLLLD